VTRLLDPEALDRKRDPRGRASIVVPQTWMREGARLEVDLPSKLRCDLCDGGGCDACERSGAYALPDDRKPITVTLPRTSDDVFALRVTNPFADVEPRMLVVHVAAGESASKGVRFVAPPLENAGASGPAGDLDPRPGVPSMPKIPGWLGTVLLVLLTGIVAAVARLSCTR
jgi:hypothetical protein